MQRAANSVIYRSTGESSSCEMPTERLPRRVADPLSLRREQDPSKSLSALDVGVGGCRFREGTSPVNHLESAAPDRTRRASWPNLSFTSCFKSFPVMVLILSS